MSSSIVVVVKSWVELSISCFIYMSTTPRFWCSFGKKVVPGPSAGAPGSSRWDKDKFSNLHGKMMKIGGIYNIACVTVASIELEQTCWRELTFGIFPVRLQFTALAQLLAVIPMPRERFEI